MRNLCYMLFSSLKDSSVSSTITEKNVQAVRTTSNRHSNCCVPSKISGPLEQRAISQKTLTTKMVEKKIEKLKSKLII